MTVTYPRTYAEATAQGDHLNENDWDAAAAAIRGATVTGMRVYPYAYLIRYRAGYYEAIDSAHNLAYGGADGAGGVSGATFELVFQASIDAARGAVNHTLTGTAARVDAHKIIFIDGDVTLTAGDIDLCDVDGLTLMGNGGDLHIQTNDPIVFDATNCYNLKVHNLNFVVDATYHPDIVWFFSRDTSTASTEFNNFTDCLFKDTDSAGCDISIIYNHASETCNYTRCRFMHNKTAIVITSTNINHIESSYKDVDATLHFYSCRGMTFYSCSWTHTNWELYYPYYAFYLDVAGETTLYACYLGAGAESTETGNGNYCFYADLTNDSVYGLNVNDTKIEGKLITCGGATILQALQGCHWRHNYFALYPGDTLQPYIDLNKANTRLVGWSMRDNTFNLWEVDDVEIPYTLDLPSTENSIIDFRNCWKEPATTFADFRDSDYIGDSSAAVTVTAFYRGSIRFLGDTGGTISCGTDTGTGADQVISHHLVEQPTMVYVSPWGSSPCYVVATSATTITIHAGNGEGFAWRAEIFYPINVP
jgi:hypothetical protein